MIYIGVDPVSLNFHMPNDNTEVIVYIFDGTKWVRLSQVSLDDWAWMSPFDEEIVIEVVDKL